MIKINEQPMTMGQWLLTFLLMGIPIVGFVLTIIWATGHDVNESKKTFFQAILLLGVMVGVFWFVIFAVAIGSIPTNLNSTLTNLYK